VLSGETALGKAVGYALCRTMLSSGPSSGWLGGAMSRRQLALQTVTALAALAALARGLVAEPALAQQRQPTEEVHCLKEESKSEDSIQAERRCLQRLTGLASRRGDALRLTLEDGSFKTFVDNKRACAEGDAEKCLLYRVAAYYPLQKLFVIELAAYESFSVLVISRRTGTVTMVDEHPHLSPGGKRLVAAAAIEAWDIDHEIVVYSVQNGSLALEWSYKAQEYEMWNFVSWDGDDRIKLEVTLWTVDQAGNRALVPQSAELRRTSPGWVLKKKVE